MTRLASALPILALLSSAPLAAQAARDFQLPPAPTPTADSRVQGPVDPDAPVPVRPRVIETAPPTPAPTASAPPVIVLPAPSPSQLAVQARQPVVRPTATATQANAPRATGAVPARAEPVPSATTEPSLALPSVPASLAPAFRATRPAAPGGAGFPWLWLVLGGLALAAIAAFGVWRRRSAAVAPPAFVVPHVPAAATGEALAITVDAVRMDRSVMNATVGYRITLRNRTAQALNGIAVEADLVSASRERPAEEQIASPGQALAPQHAAERLAPGGSLRFEGQVRLPLSEASAIWQGRVGLLVPLLRVRATAAGTVPVATTLVIGRKEGSTARPQPFRLDEPPRSYAPLAQRVLDAVPAQA